MNHDHRPERAAAMTAVSTADQDPLDQRASLRDQALRAVWQLGSLVRRVEREAPEVHRRLRCAVEALQLLSAKLALAEAADPVVRVEAGPRGETLPSEGRPAGLEGLAEFF